MQMNPRRLLSSTALFVLVSLAAACAVGPNYRKPSVDTPPAFKEQPQATGTAAAGPWKPASPNDDVLRGKWWEVFGDPQLNALEEQVSVSNQTLAQAEAQFRGARAAVAGARSDLFPTVTAGLSASRSRTVLGRTAGAASTAATTATVYQLPVDFTYEADVWGRVRRTVEANIATAQASAADLENVRLSLQAELAVDYFQLHGLDEQRALLDTAVGSYQTALQLTTNRHNQG
ncbi:MAG TPA: TolC family protein, partial [Thermoanaerobaculia bacterium]|nr:TolC family protein [Thermoanaerobaculia bacterium]